MQYFDFHTHPILKQLFSESGTVTDMLGRNEVKVLQSQCTDIPNIIQSQIHPSQLGNYAEGVLLGIVLYSMESYLAAEVIPLRQHLRAGSQHKLSEPLLKKIVRNEYKAYTDFLINRTLNAYLDNSDIFNVITRDTFTNGLRTDRINIFFVVEGCHSFVDSVNRTGHGKFFPVDEIVDNLDRLLARNVPILAVNLTHMQQSSLCNHAFGIQLTDPKPFFPTGNGMEPDGYAVAQALFDRGIHPDLKHMSYKSRRDLMRAVDGVGNTPLHSPMPLLCSHAGFTGIPFEAWPEYAALIRAEGPVVRVEMAKTLSVESNPSPICTPTFNMSTINLFDEEIAWIVSHGGMIGLSMDRRILGYVDPFDADVDGRLDGDFVVDTEFISLAEWDELQIDLGKYRKKVDADHCLTVARLKKNWEEQGMQERWYFDHIFLHLKHFFQTCLRAGIPLETSIRHITIGSDFDGLINPFITMPGVRDMERLKRTIRNEFKVYLSQLEDASEWCDDLDVAQFAENLFFENGYRFVKDFMER
ncbi:hypothetical protein [Chitinophaga rhizosphaerae]|uniref:hypothetical protein n=1 Tax=Chitinophaga rhizosphaerae TaxID=1864947 RepID=UPI000F814AF1|nr:hypothetical protein [Chitinophaga rhizosphaerae]